MLWSCCCRSCCCHVVAILWSCCHHASVLLFPHHRVVVMLAMPRSCSPCFGLVVAIVNVVEFHYFLFDFLGCIDAIVVHCLVFDFIVYFSCRHCRCAWLLALLCCRHCISKTLEHPLIFLLALQHMRVGWCLNLFGCYCFMFLHCRFYDVPLPGKREKTHTLDLSKY
jgi:hypothetical protein